MFVLINNPKQHSKIGFKTSKLALCSNLIWTWNIDEHHKIQTLSCGVFVGPLMFSAGHNRCPTCAALNLKKHSSLHAAECGLLKQKLACKYSWKFQWEFQYPKISWNGGTVPYKAICCWDIPLHKPYIGLKKIVGNCNWGSWNCHWKLQVPKSWVYVHSFVYSGFSGIGGNLWIRHRGLL